MPTEKAWISVGELSKGFDENRMKATSVLSGREFTLYFKGGRAVTYEFKDQNTLRWEVIEGTEEGQSREVSYDATMPRDGIFFVDYTKISVERTTVSLLLDFNDGITTAIIGTLPTEREASKSALQRAVNDEPMSAVSVDVRSAAINDSFIEDTRQHRPTTDLIGKRIQYTYSSKDAYEHIYLNENRYTWHCLSGPEKGLADTEECQHFKLGEDLYLFAWQEKIIPTLGIVVIDLENKKTTGKLLGYEENDFEELSNFVVGAYVKSLNETDHDLSVSYD
jgi:hypothetical protein